MNILNKLTIKNLKLNKKRTIVTIIGIMLSTALICAVVGMVSSFQATLIEYAKIEEGNRHLTIEEVKEQDLKYFINNNHVKTMYLVDNLGYAKLDASQNENKPYLYIKAYTPDAYLNTTIRLVDGRLPKDENEIIISESIIKNAKVAINIGDTLVLDISTRKCEDGSILNQRNPLIIDEADSEYYCHEYLDYEYTKEYKVVGIMERPSYSIEDYSSPGYTCLTYTEKVSTDKVDVSLLFKDNSYYQEFIDNLNNSSTLNKYNINKNEELLRFTGVGLSDNTMGMLIAVASVVIIIIIITSIFVIKNSFDISITEKTKQYGMLSSVGATSKQIKKNVLYEGLILGVIGIPLGILCGIIADFVLVQVINYFSQTIFNDIKFVFEVSILAIILSIILSSITIFISTIRTSQKTSKIAPISAIRNNDEIKINKGMLKSPKLVTKLFGIGGEIAYKNLKRSKKKYRTTVISIVVSVAIFIALSSFIEYGFKITSSYYTDYQYNIEVRLIANNNDAINAYQGLNELDNIKASALRRTMTLEVDPIKYCSNDVFKYMYGTTKEKVLENNPTASLYIVSLGNEEYTRFIKEIGGNIKDNEAILIDDISVYDRVSDKYKTVNYYNIVNDSIVGYDEDGVSYTFNVAKRTDKRPMGLEEVYVEGGFLIVSDAYMDTLKPDDITYMYFDSSDSNALESDIDKYLSSNVNLSNNSIYNVDADVRAQKAIIILVSIFLYGFIIVISLIGITNIFNTITSNMNLRKKEFAMLKSVGMTNKEFNHMIGLESFMYGSKSLVIGIPLGLLGSFAIYMAFASGNDMKFTLPIKAIIISIIIVYLLVSIIMHYSLKKSSRQNIIETIRNDNI